MDAFYRDRIEGGGTTALFNDPVTGNVASRLTVDHAQGDAVRRRNRDALDAGGGPGTGFAAGDWLGEGFTFTVAEYQLLQKIKPFLFDGSGADRRRHWIDFAQSSEGKYFRTR